MKSTLALRFSIKRLVLFTLVSLVAVAVLLGIAASANKANRAAKAREAQASASKFAIIKNSSQEKPLAPLAPGVSATLTDNVTPNTTKVAPGATVNYTAQITSTGGAGEDATTVNYNAPLDSNETFVAGTLHASPIAFNDTYSWVGNTQLDTTARALPVVTANDVAVNATLPTPTTDTFNLVTQTNAPTTLSGTVTVNANGSFVYNPPVGRPNAGDGASVNDTFTYQITNSADPTLVGTGTVTITLTGRVWYLVAGGAGDGRSHTPSGSPAAMSTAADKSSDIFYIFSNAGTLNGPFTLENSQQLLGQGVNLVVNTITLFTAGTAPTHTNTTGNAVAIASNNLLTGFGITQANNAAIVGTAAGGTTNITGVPIANSATGGGLNLTTQGGTLNLTNSPISGTSSGTAVLVNGGAANINFSNSPVSRTTGRLIDMQNKTGGTVLFNGGSTVASTGNITTDAVVLQNHTGGTVFTFSNNVTVTTSTGRGILASNTAGTFTLTMNAAANSISATGGAALDVEDVVANMSFTSTSSTNSSAVPAHGVRVNNTSGSLSFGPTTVAGSDNSAVLLTANSSTLTFGALTLTPDSGQRGLHATTNTGALTIPSGTISTTNHTAVEIVGVSAASRTPLNVQLTSVSALASGGNPPNGIVLVSTSATGAPGGFRVLGSGGSCTFATPTCTGGRLTTTTGADNTTGGIGVRMFDADTVVLTRMRIDNHPNHAIRGTNVNGFTLDTSVIDGTNGSSTTGDDDGVGTSGEGAVRFTNLSGSAAVTNCFIGGAHETIFRVNNNTGTLNRLTISGSTIGDLDGGGAGFGNSVAGGDDALQFEAKGAVNATLNVTLSNNILNQAKGDVVQVAAQQQSTIDLVMRGNSVSNSHSAIVSGVGGITIGATSGVGQTSNLTYDISCNKFQDAVGNAITLFKGVGGTSNMTGTVFNNRIGVTGVVGSASDTAAGIQVDAQGTGTHTVLLKNNQIRRHNFAGISMQSGDGSATLNATVIGNFVAEPGGFGFAGLYVESGALPASDTIKVNLKNGGAGAEQNNFVDGDPGNFSDVLYSKIGAGTQFNLSRGVSASNDPGVITQANNVAPITVSFPAGLTPVNTVPALPAAIDETCSPPPIPNPADDTLPEHPGVVDDPTPAAVSSTLPLVATQQPAPLPETSVSTAAVKPIAPTVNDPSVNASAVATKKSSRNERHSHHAVRSNSKAFATAPSMVLAGETINVPIGTLPPGKVITIKYAATINAPPLARQVSTQGTVSGSNFASVPTDDPDAVGTTNPTDTLVDTLMTWNGVTSADWNTATNWTQPAGGTPYAPGVSNPAVNDVVIPNVGNQPNINATDIGIFSLNIANGRTLTITSPRVLTIGGAPGGDLTLDGIISGGNLNLGTGTHVISNAGGTGSLSSTNVATVLSGSTVTLNHNLQAGALAVNAGGSMNITNRTLSLNGSGAALVIPGGATFTTTGSTVAFNGTAAQQAAGIAYNNLTINNSIGLNVTGVTLTGNATVNGVLALTSSDLDTSTFALTQPNTTASTGVSDVVGTVTRSGGPFPLGPLTFGNPNNIITFTGVGTRPTTMTVVMAKVAPATYTSAVQRNYNISQTGGSGFTASVRLHYLDSELNGNTPETSLGLRRLRTSDSHWVAAPPPPGTPTRDGTANWVEAAGVTAADLVTQWTFAVLTPTAANGTVTGRIVDGGGTPVEGAVVRMDGAQTRKFITDANGFYRFENVETGGFYTVTPSRANYSFSPSARSFSLIGETTQASFGATLSSGNLANPLDTPEYFVRQHYIDFLGREPDESGFNFWSDQMLECGNDNQCLERRRENVSAAYFLSMEFQHTGGLVEGLYRASYGARPNFSEFMPDTRTVGLGVVVGREGWQAKLEENKRAFIDSFVQRPAFINAYGNMDHSLFVDTLISHTGVSFTAAERDALLSGLSTGSMTRAEALRSIAENNRFASAKFNETFVMMEYFGYLRRDGDANGFAFWLNKLNEFNGNFEQAEMVKAFIVSGEYRDRFPR